MKALKSFSTGLALAGVLSAAAVAVSAPVAADDRNDYRGSFDSPQAVLSVLFGGGVRNVDYRDSRYDRNNRRYDRYDRYNRHDRYDRVSYRSNRPVTLQLDYHANGAGTIRLKRLLRDQYGIDSSEWRIRSVNVRNKSRYDACADLTIGGRSTGAVYLPRGTTTIAAPRGSADGRWVLGFENAKVRDVAVTLVPRHNARGRDYDRGRNRDDRRYRPLDRNDDYASRDLRSRGLVVR